MVCASRFEVGHHGDQCPDPVRERDQRGRCCARENRGEGRRVREKGGGAGGSAVQEKPEGRGACVCVV